MQKLKMDKADASSKSFSRELRLRYLITAILLIIGVFLFGVNKTVGKYTIVITVILNLLYIVIKGIKQRDITVVDSQVGKVRWRGRSLWIYIASTLIVIAVLVIFLLAT